MTNSLRSLQFIINYIYWKGFPLKFISFQALCIKPCRMNVQLVTASHIASLLQTHTHNTTIDNSSNFKNVHGIISDKFTCLMALTNCPSCLCVTVTVIIIVAIYLPYTVAVLHQWSVRHHFSFEYGNEKTVGKLKNHVLWLSCWKLECDLADGIVVVKIHIIFICEIFHFVSFNSSTNEQTIRRTGSNGVVVTQL